MRHDEITALFDVWNSALQSGDPDRVTALYADDAILLPTLSNRVRRNHAEIRDYFTQLLSRKLTDTIINESNVRTFEQLATNSGIYTFSFKDGASLPARFTFVYRWDGERWLIIEHHSSPMPE